MSTVTTADGLPNDPNLRGDINLVDPVEGREPLVRGGLSFQAGPRLQFQRPLRVEADDRPWQVLGCERTVVLHQALERLPRQIQTIEIRVAVLELGHEARRPSLGVERGKVI